MPPFAALRAFEAVGRLGGVRKASRELGIDHAVVSRHIRTLEAWVGRPLLTRETAGYHLTEAGQDYHENICQALSLISTATAELMNVGERLKISVWCIPGFGFLWLSDRLNEFLSENPDIDLDFKPSDVSPDFRAREGDADIRYLRNWEDAPMPKGLHHLELSRPNVFPVASPAFIAQMGPIRSPSDLLQYPLLHEDNDLEWRHWFDAQGVPCDGRLPGPRLWHAHLTLNSARQGHGIALANSMLLSSTREDGQLQRLRMLDAAFNPVQFGSYTLFARGPDWNAPALKRFRVWLRNAINQYERAEKDAAFVDGVAA